jgi:hypothetical protein
VVVEAMSVRWRRWSRALLAIAVLIAVVAAVPAWRRSVLRGAGWALVVDDPVEPVDVIVVPRWAGSAAAIDAADLVHGGIAGRVAVLREPPKPADQELTRRGVPHVDENAAMVHLLGTLGVAAVEVIPEAATGTEAEGQVLAAWCGTHQFRSVLVLSSPDHSRRVRRVLRRAWRGHPTKLTVRSARYSPFDPDSWWRTREGLRTEITEIQKLLLDVARHPIS